MMGQTTPAGTVVLIKAGRTHKVQKTGGRTHKVQTTGGRTLMKKAASKMMMRTRTRKKSKMMRAETVNKRAVYVINAGEIPRMMN